MGRRGGGSGGVKARTGSKGFLFFFFFSSSVQVLEAVVQPFKLSSRRKGRGRG